MQNQTHTLSEQQLRIRWYRIIALAFLVPPLSGVLIMSFIGVYPVPDIFYIFFQFSGIYLITCLVAAIWVSQRYLSGLVEKSNTGTLTRKDLRFLEWMPWIFIGVISIYTLGGVTSANLSLSYFLGHNYGLQFYLKSYISMTPIILITAFPIFFYLSDVMGAFLAPKGIKIYVAPVWLKLTILGLFTPVLIDTLLILYFYDRTGYFTSETLGLWVALIVTSAIGTWMAYRSFRQGIIPLQTVLSGDWEADNMPALHAMTLDEHGRIVGEWSKLVHKLKESRERYELAVAGSDDGIWDWNILTGEDYFSPRWLELLGYDENDNIPGKYETFLKFMHPDDKDRVLKALEDHLQHNLPYNIELRLQRKDGSYGWYLTRGKAVRDNEGNPVRMAGSIGDITTQKEHDESMMRLNRLIDSGRDFIGYASPDGIPIYINQAGMELVGIENEEISNYPVIEYFPEYEQPRINNEVIPHVLEHGQWSGESIFKHFKTGELIPVYYHMFCIQSKEPSDPWFFGTVTKDLRPLKKVEDKLQSERLFIDTVLDSANAIVVVLDEKGCFTRFNKAAENITLYDAPEVLGKKPWDFLLRPEDIEPVKSVFNDLATDMLDGVHINYWVTKDKDQRLIEWNNSVIRDNEERFLYVVAVGRDITDQEAALRTIRNQSMIINQIHDSVVSTDLNGYVTSWNKGAENMFGYTAVEMIGKHISVVYPEDQQEVLLHEVIGPLKANGEHEAEPTMLRKNGERFVGHLALSMQYDDLDQPIGMIGYTMDITERKRVEEQLDIYRNQLEKMVEERTKELKDAQDELLRSEKLATLGQLTATVSHELRNPLAAMQPALYTISKHLPPENDRTQVAVERIQRNIERCDTIIDELLDYTRTGNLDVTSCMLGDWISSVLDNTDIPDDIQINRSRSQDTKDIEVHMDLSRMQRALSNILENAFQALCNPENAEIEQENKQIDISIRQTPELVEILIADNGPGVPDEIREKIFEPLFSTKTFGVGLGMPTVQQILRQHGGDIELVSDSDKGATFRLWIPQHNLDKKSGMDNN